MKANISNGCFIVLCVLLFGCYSKVFAFEISVYNDATSWVNERWFWQISGTATYDECINAIAPGHNSEVLRWWEDMGVTILCVNYLYSSNPNNWTDIDAYDGQMKVMNGNWPQFTYKYVNADSRFIDAGEDPNLHYWDYVNSENYGEGADTVQGVQFTPFPNQSFVNVLRIGPGNGATDAGYMWQPHRNITLGEWWDWWSFSGAHEYARLQRLGQPTPDSLKYEPLHIRLICDVVPNPAYPDSQRVARFSWLVHSVDGDHNGWWQYPPVEMILDSFTHASAFDTIETVIYPQNGTFIFLNNETFQPEDTVYYYPFWGRLTANMMVEWAGFHQFDLYRIEVWDEGYQRLYYSGEQQSTIYNSIANSFSQELAAHPKSVGWYYDEWVAGDLVRPLVRVNNILQHNAHVPTFHINGICNIEQSNWNSNPDPNYRNNLFAVAAEENVDLPVHMQEFYPYGNKGHGCVPMGYDGFGHAFVLTDTTSDGEYIVQWNVTGNLDCPTQTPCNRSYDSLSYGHRSLQCALDEALWGGLPTHSVEGSFLANMDYVHAQGKKLWALIAGGEDQPDNPCYFASLRPPTCNELKLSAWLTVGCDADGIMWYNGDFGGLMHWEGGHFSVPGSNRLVPNERYWAAAHVDSEIVRIAQILDSLEFKGTLASRRYEQNYGTPENPQVMLRTVSQPLPPCYRSEEPIYSYLDFIDTKIPVPPDSTPELNVYREESPDSSYVQVSRWESYGNNIEEYWFLIVNRRALHDEIRTVTLGISNVQEPDSLYMVDKVLSGQSQAAVPYLGPYGMTGRSFSVTLEPGEAELVHYHLSNLQEISETWVNGVVARRADSTSIILHWPVVTQTDSGQNFDPYYYMVISSNVLDGDYSIISCTPDNYYVDQNILTSYSKHYYQVKAVGVLHPWTCATNASGLRTKVKSHKQVRI